MYYTDTRVNLTARWFLILLMRLKLTSYVNPINVTKFGYDLVTRHKDNF